MSFAYINHHGFNKPTTPTRAARRMAAQAAGVDLPTVAAASFVGFLALACSRRGLNLPDVCRQLARGGECSCDPAWMAAVRARELALYLANTLGNVPQIALAYAVGLTPAAVCQALHRVEERRDDMAFEAEVRALTRMITGRDE